MFPILELQQQIHSRLSADIKTYPILDKLAENGEENYITIGEFEYLPNRTKYSIGYDITHIIYCRSLYEGNKRISEIMDNVLNSLVNFSPELVGYSITQVKTNSGKVGLYKKGDAEVGGYGKVSITYTVRKK